MDWNVTQPRTDFGSSSSSRRYVALGFYLRAALIGAVLALWACDLIVARAAVSATAATLLFGGILIAVLAARRLRTLVNQLDEPNPAVVSGAGDRVANTLLAPRKAKDPKIAYVHP